MENPPPCITWQALLLHALTALFIPHHAFQFLTFGLCVVLGECGSGNCHRKAQRDKRKNALHAATPMRFFSQHQTLSGRPKYASTIVPLMTTRRAGQCVTSRQGRDGDARDLEPRGRARLKGDPGIFPRTLYRLYGNHRRRTPANSQVPSRIVLYPCTFFSTIWLNTRRVTGQIPTQIPSRSA